MKLVLPGGSGHLGQLLAQAFTRDGHEVVVLGRHRPQHGRGVGWDGRRLGPWAAELDGADAVINLAGRSVNCRYTKTNLTHMLASRVDATRVVGQAIQQAQHPPPVWLQMSTATIYAHRFAAANDEWTGCLGGHEPGAPAYWRMSVEIATAWERTLAEASMPATRKVALRTAMVMDVAPGGTFDLLSRLVCCGLGGPLAGGRQYVSWIHAHDFVRAVQFLLARSDLAGPVNLAAPTPLPQGAFMAALRRASGVRLALPASAWMARLGAIVMGTDAELVLKSRRVVPGRLIAAGFVFTFPDWPAAAADLVAHRTQRRP